LVGGVLTPLYAEARQTQDIDLLIELQFKDEDRTILTSELKKYKFQPFTTWDDTFVEWPTTHFITFLDPSGNLKIDLNLTNKNEAPKDQYDVIRKLAISHRVKVKFINIVCWAQSKEDFILGKLVYAGIQDYNDALACWIRFEEQIDQRYLDEKSKELDIENYWKMLKEKKPVDEVYPD
jgi:hypothetical protein